MNMRLNTNTSEIMDPVETKHNNGPPISSFVISKRAPTSVVPIKSLIQSVNSPRSSNHSSYSRRLSITMTPERQKFLQQKLRFTSTITALPDSRNHQPPKQLVYRSETAVNSQKISSENMLQL